MADRLDETIPGGRYLAADGQTYVDAWGNPIADQPAATDAPAAPAAADSGDQPKPQRQTRRRGTKKDD